MNKLIQYEIYFVATKLYIQTKTKVAPYTQTLQLYEVTDLSKVNLLDIVEIK